MTLPRLPARTQLRQVTGTLVALPPPVLSVATRRDTVGLLPDSIMGFEVSRGRESRQATMAVVGAAAGLILGYVASQVSHPLDTETTPREVVTVTLVGGFLGTGLGVAIGSQMKVERWVVIPVPR